MAILTPAGPAMAQLQLHAHRVEPPQPGAQQRRSLERFRKNAAAGTDEGRLPQRIAPCAQAIRRKCFDRSRELRHRFAVAREKLRQRLAVREVEPATPGHQEFAAGRRHRIIDCYVGAALRQHLGRHQPGRTGADDGDVVLSWRHGVSLGLDSRTTKQSSCPGLSRASTSGPSSRAKDVDGRDKPGHDGGVRGDYPALKLDPRPRRGLPDIFLRLLERALQRPRLCHVADLGEMRRDRLGRPVGLG